MRSLRTRLLVGFVLVAWLSVAAVGMITVSLTMERFEAYLEQQGRDRPGITRGPAAGGPPFGPWGRRPHFFEWSQRRRFLSAVAGPPEHRFLGDLQRVGWGGAMAGVVIALIVGTLTTRQIIAPVQRLTAAARRIGAGDLRSQVPVDRPDELGDLARTFNDMAAQLRAAEEARRRLLADIVHELGTPLAALQANLEGMLDGVVDPTPERVGSMHAQTEVLGRLIRDLRDLSLAQQRQLPLDLRPVELRALVGEVVEMSQPVADENQIVLTISAPAPLHVQADRDRIAQVLHNLVSNALRHTEAGGRVEISLRGSQEEAIVEVADTGAGVPPQDLPHVFERFYRVDPSRSRATGGTGLGLAIVKSLVEAHGGRVWATSRPGEGSIFGFSLRVAVP